MTVVFIILAFILAAGVFLFFFPLAIIVGDSMLPNIKDGEVYLARRLLSPRTHNYFPSKVYVFRPPNGTPKYVVKRLVAVADGVLSFEGDNKNASFDSRHYGVVDMKAVIAKVLVRLPIKLRKV